MRLALLHCQSWVRRLGSTTNSWVELL